MVTLDDVYSAQFLEPDPAKRPERCSGSVVVSVSPSDVVAFGFSIRLFSRSRQVERAYSSTLITQCKSCFGFRCQPPDAIQTSRSGPYDSHTCSLSIRALTQPASSKVMPMPFLPAVLLPSLGVETVKENTWPLTPSPQTGHNPHKNRWRILPADYALQGIG